MYVSYDRLLEMLNKRKLKKSDLIPLAGINSNAVSDIGKGEMITINTLTKICRFFLCQPSDIMEIKYEPKEIHDFYMRKLVRILTRSDVIKIRSDDGTIDRYYMLKPDPSTGDLNKGNVRFLTEISVESNLDGGIIYERDHTGSLVPADVERIVKKIEQNGVIEEYQKADLVRESKRNTNSPYNDM